MRTFVIIAVGLLLVVLGASSLYSVDQAEFGYWIGKEFWSRGYATEAAAAAIDYAFRSLGVNRVEALHFIGNSASGRVMEKCGMRHEGTLRQARKKWGEYVDVKVYAIVRGDWEGQRGT